MTEENSGDDDAEDEYDVENGSHIVLIEYDCEICLMSIPFDHVANTKSVLHVDDKAASKRPDMAT